jgi:hypothetical protein
MIKPTNFTTNYETLQDNKFMVENKDSSTQQKALEEFNQIVSNIEKNNIDVMVYNQCHKEAVDSVFPNNWFSTHKNEDIPEGLLIIYPLKSPLRRLERNADIIKDLKSKYEHFVDLSYLENKGEYLESTGSLIFDNLNKRIYCNISERATENALNIFIKEFNKYSKKGYSLITFSAVDKNGDKIYHTNVMMTILENHVVICSNTIKNKKDKMKVLKLAAENRKIIRVSFNEMNNFCCNMINVKSKNGKNIVVILSKTAYDHFQSKNKKILEKNYTLCINDLKTIELVGGGSARCMVGEIFDHY